MKEIMELCRKGGFIFKDQTYCEFDGIMLKKPEILIIKVYLKIRKKLKLLLMYLEQ